MTAYLEFHPGGIPELLRAAGTDGTDLFNQYHAWVNYENMLKSCYVGQFKGDTTKCEQRERERERESARERCLIRRFFPL